MFPYLLSDVCIGYAAVSVLVDVGPSLTMVTCLSPKFIHLN